MRIIRYDPEIKALVWNSKRYMKKGEPRRKSVTRVWLSFCFRGRSCGQQRLALSWILDGSSCRVMAVVSRRGRRASSSCLTWQGS